MPNIDELIQLIKKYNTKADTAKIREAFEFAQMAHKSQKRKTGEPYVTHSLATAITLAKMKMDAPTIIAGLLHDVPEDTTYTLVDIEKKFGGEVSQLVTGITKLGKIKYRGIDKFSENLRKMFVSMAEDIRVIFIKMADRLNNMETLYVHPPHKRKRIALEVMEIYAPIARRLGMDHIKGELEDLAFPHVHPDDFEWFKKNIAPVYHERMEHINRIRKELEKELHSAKIKTVSIHGRKKHYYSLYQKLLRPQYSKDILRIYDLVALRIIVQSVSDCYKVLGIIHSRWKPLPGRIKDYIALPKPNNYQSIHTTVFTSEGKIVEFQIRTQHMHERAEYGIAAHWNYKEQRMKIFSRLPGFHPKGYSPPKKLQWMKELAETQKDIKDHKQYIHSLKIDALKNRIFVFTPHGDVIDLPEDATPIDFAYHIHTEIGNKCTAVKINSAIARLDTQLKNGDLVEIITDKNRKGPSSDWLKFAKTSTARAKIKSFFYKNNSNSMP